MILIPTPEHVEAVLLRRSKAKAEYDAAVEEYERLFTGGPPIVRRKRDGSLTQKVFEALTEDPTRIFTIPEVAQILREEDKNKIGRMLFKLAKSKAIMNRGHGKYSSNPSSEAAT